MKNEIRGVYTLAPAMTAYESVNRNIETINAYLKTVANQQPSIQHLSIIILTYNEENRIAKIPDHINEETLIHDIKKEVIVIKDCSKDNTEAAIHNYKNNTSNLTKNYYKYIEHEVNQGKGAATHTGIAQATG